MPQPRVIVDASVLYQRHLRNALVWHSLAGLYEMCWTEILLEEVRRNLTARNISRHGEARTDVVDRILGRMTDALSALYQDAEVPAAEVQALLGKMTNDLKDRHVLAAAVAAGAPFIATVNLKDFRREDTGRHGVEALSPDALLVRLIEEEGAIELCTAALTHHADFHGWTVEQLLGMLAKPGESRPAWLPRYVHRYEALTSLERVDEPG